ncbi:hypothetical protein ACJEIK_29150 [Mycobacterium sp. SMC-16]|jgi:hypothetical protein|uniref:ESX-1 secretion-associated protein n=1 Tax=Mycolicibacterium mucogenicum TaxID=56689 RepID=A0A1A0N1C8_MYCMU|nr:hypothetical protein [Mycolicibacterium mucogenicum]OBA90848.1 hypothetical protein A5642_11870 [Mycolicibacterium mucogenicum]
MGELHVDVDGLRSGAASSGALAAGLTAGADAGTPGATHASVAGVAAMDAAIAATATLYSDRITGQADALTSGATGYQETDEGGGRAVTAVSV